MSTTAWFLLMGCVSFLLAEAQEIMIDKERAADSVAAGDLNSDGAIDIITSYKGDINLYMNDGNQIFDHSVLHHGPTLGGTTAVLSDLDGDGDLDVLAGSSIYHTISWFENIGGEFPTPKRVIDAAMFKSPVAFDVNSDGLDDIVVARYDENKVVWYENLGGGEFDPAYHSIVDVATPLCVLLEDLSGDGKADLVVATFHDPNGEIAWAPCGCPCNGVRNEQQHLPCLKHELKIAEEFCGICYVENLIEAPCIQFQGECGHTFHYQCVLNKLRAGYPGARINFEFISCPLCKIPMDHPSLEKELAPILKAREDIKRRSMDRLKYEGRQNDPAITKPNGRFHNNPVAFALFNYLFYKCFKCHKPYFAGGYQCQEADAPFDPEELVCPSCQPQIVKDCPVHGKDWLAFKCRYCCNISSWYCWGNTHFCDKCHKSGVWQKLSEMRTGKNKMKLWEYEQCAGVKAKMKPILARKDLSNDEKEKLCEQLTADPATCPLHVPHTVNGTECGLGCSMCEDKKSEAENIEAARKAKEEQEKKRAELDGVKKELSRQGQRGLRLKFSKDFDKNGLFYYLGTCGKTRPWSNPADSGFVDVSSSGTMNDSMSLSALVGREVVRCVTKPNMNGWIKLDLIDLAISPTHYALRHYSSWDTECLRHWVLEGSKDGVSWTVLRKHDNDTSLQKRGDTKTWSINAKGERFRMFRLVQIGPNSNDHFYLALSGIELWGQLYDARESVEAAERKQVELEQEEEKGMFRKQFKYQHDLDTNGVFYYLGTNMGADDKWVNPHLRGLCNVSALSLAQKPASKPAFCLVGRSLVRLVSVPKPGQWFIVDLKDKRLNVTHYTLRHYDSWDTEAIRNWRFEGSNDGEVWYPLRIHENDESIQRAGQAYTWAIENPEMKGAYSMFRILQTGKNSNNHYYLALSGMELYGTLTQLPPLRLGGVKEFRHMYDSDTNGLIYWLGTRGLRAPFLNPALQGIVTTSASQMCRHPPSKPVWAIVGRQVVRCVSAAKPNMWMMVDLRDKEICLKHYSLRHYSTWDTEALRCWRLEGSNDGNNWTLLKQHQNDKSLNKKGCIVTWEVNSRGQSFRMFRVLQTALNSNNHHYLSLSGMEFYGTARDIVKKHVGVAQPRRPHPVSPSPARVSRPGEVQLKFRNGAKFQYHHDFDENGILFWLGTGQRTHAYQNPARLGAIEVKASSIGSQSYPAWAAAGRDVVRCVSKNVPKAWFTFDLKNVFVIVTGYTLRHYDSWDTEALRSWRLEASYDNGKNWRTLHNAKKDKSLDHKGASHTWVIRGERKSYNLFRVFQTGKNSNKHHYLALSGFELYGRIFNYRHKD